jgi:RNA polymerase sigma factor (sigma-70 family)
LRGTPEEIFAILRSATSATPHARLEEVLDGFRRYWLAIAYKRHPRLHEDFEDMTQLALLRLVSPERLDQLQDVAKLAVWARSIFVNTMLDVVRDRGWERSRRVYLGTRDDDPENVLRERLPSHEATPEEVADRRERLRIAARCLEGLEAAKLKFVDGLPEKEIAARCQMTRDAVAGQLKRLRQVARRALGDRE